MGVSAEFALSLTLREQLALYISLGEQRGGDWDFEHMRWYTEPPPSPVFAIPAEIKSN